MYSYHIFMLPFKFEIENKFDRFQTELIESIGWHPKTDGIESNEALYYYDYVTDIIHATSTQGDEKPLYYYEYKLTENEKYTFYIKDQRFSLDLKKVTLRIFGLGVGILSFHIENHEYSELETINKINDYGKRVYPQFLPIEGKGGAKEAFLASKFEILGKEESFKNFDTHDKLPSFIKMLLPKDPIFHIDPIVDDRMFVMCWHKNKLIESLQDYKEETETYGYQSSGEWYRFLFCDGNYLTCQSKKMIQELIKKYTYDRWIDYGSLYGVTRYSFMLMTNENPPAYLIRHIHTIYFQMMIILFMNKATILKFSKEIADISNDISKLESDEENEQIVNKISVLYRRYIEFVNRYYFREITAQEQGIELYNQTKQIMNIDESVTNLGNEINELYQYASLVKEKQSSKEMGKLTQVATYFLPATLVVGIFGMNTFPEKSIDNYQWLGISIVLIIVSFFITNFVIKIKK